MKKLTKKMKEQLDYGTPEGRQIQKHWDSGALFLVSLDWDTDAYVIDANEVMNALQTYLNKWPGIKKFHVEGKPGIFIQYTR
jgi:hypothetical protein